MITHTGLNVIITDYSVRIVKVRINGSIVITEFATKKVVGNVLTLEFDMVEGVSNVRLIELLNRDDVVLSRATLFVPVDIDTRFKYVTKVEGL